MTRPKLKNVVFGVVAPLWILFVALNCSFCVAMQEEHNAGYHDYCSMPDEFRWTPSVSATAPAPAPVPSCVRDFTCIGSPDYEILDEPSPCNEKTPWNCYGS
jgi:hypothetical protein